MEERLRALFPPALLLLLLLPLPLLSLLLLPSRAASLADSTGSRMPLLPPTEAPEERGSAELPESREKGERMPLPPLSPLLLLLLLLPLPLLLLPLLLGCSILERSLRSERAPLPAPGAAAAAAEAPAPRASSSAAALATARKPAAPPSRALKPPRLRALLLSAA